MCHELDGIDDYDSMLIYAPEYHKLAELSRACRDIHGREVNLVDTPCETVTALTAVPEEFIELPEKKADVDTQDLIRAWLTENNIAILDDVKNDDSTIEAVNFRDPVSKVVKFLAQYFPQLKVILRSYRKHSRRTSIYYLLFYVLFPAKKE